MGTASILFNQKPVSVTLIGTDHKLLPSLISALRSNKLTMSHLKSSLERIELFSAEAVLYSSDGHKARIPIF
jgi:hypothetical protein